jgi:hypothetical protein
VPICAAPLSRHGSPSAPLPAWVRRRDSAWAVLRLRAMAMAWPAIRRRALDWPAARRRALAWLAARRRALAGRQPSAPWPGRPPWPGPPSAIAPSSGSPSMRRRYGPSAASIGLAWDRSSRVGSCEPGNGTIRCGRSASLSTEGHFGLGNFFLTEQYNGTNGDVK